MPPPQQKRVNKKNDVPPPPSPSPSNGKYLVIVESPSKCDKIEKYLNETAETAGATVIATRGHLYKIKALKDIDMKNGKFEINYSILEGKDKYVVEMRNKIKKGGYDKVVLATDGDREGEFIAWTICDLFKLPVETTPRIIFHEITKPAIINAINNPTIININLVYAQQSRTVLDLLIGYKISPILWKYMVKPRTTTRGESGEVVCETTLSAGRCQTPALKLIYETAVAPPAAPSSNEFEYSTKCEFSNIPLQFTLSPPLVNAGDNDGKCITDFINNETAVAHNMLINEAVETVRKPPEPLNTSSLLQQASIKLNMSPKQTMQIAQQLYQEGHITYMRTESKTLSTVFKTQARDFIMKKYGGEYLHPDTAIIGEPAKGESVIELPHEAIRCTHLETINILDDGAAGAAVYKNKLYRLIWRHSIYSLMSDMRMKTVKVEVNTHTPMYKWKSQIELITFKGWQIIDGTAAQPPPEEASTPTPKRTLSDENEFNKLMALLKKQEKSPPPPEMIEVTNQLKMKHSKHYTESGLIKKLEDIGIGRPSTFHTIVETIKERGYVIKGNIEGIEYDSTTYTYKRTVNKIETTKKKKRTGDEKGKLIITELGIKTLSFLVKHFEKIFNYEYTANMETLLDRIASGTVAQRSVCNDCLKQIKECISEINITPLVFEENGKQYEIYYSLKGPLIRDFETKEIYNIKNGVNIDDIIKQINDGGGDIHLKDIAMIPLMGEYNGLPVYAKVGRYGPYIQWGTNNYPVKTIENITMEDVIQILESKVTATAATAATAATNGEEGGKGGEAAAQKGGVINKKILRVINDEFSIRKGKYAQPYVYYKDSKMKEPRFIPLKGTGKEWWKNCKTAEFMEWVRGVL